MSPSARDVVDFIQAQLPRQQRYFGATEMDKVLAHVASTSVAGSLASVSSHRLLSLDRGTAPSELVARVAGALPRLPGAGEIVTVCLFNQLVGYQVKTRLAATPGAVEAGGGATTVRGNQVYTLHHSPFMMTAFERVPLEQVLGSVGGARFALVGVGAQVNLSPRFNWHTEIRDGRLTLFHGDGLPLKTYLNLKTNPQVVRVLLDPETFGGFLLAGRVEEFEAEAEPAAHQAIVAGFQAGGWGRPARTFRFTAETITPLVPAG
jgi:hypothetical protein